MLPLVLTTDVLRKPQETDLIERLEYAVRDATAHADTSQPVGRANAAAKGSGSRRTYKFFIPVRKFTPQRILTCASRKAILLDKNLSAVLWRSRGNNTAIQHTLEVNEEAGTEISSSEVERAAEYFTVKNNTSSAFAIKLKGSYLKLWRSPKPWKTLETLDSVYWNGTIYRIGDIIHIRQDDARDPIGIAEIAEIRSLEDSRSVLRVFWFYIRPKVKGKLMNIKSTHMDVVMWDCATGKLSDADLQTIWEGKVLDMSKKPYTVRDEDSSSVSWAKTRWTNS